MSSIKISAAIIGGRLWLKNLTPEDRKIFARIGLAAAVEKYGNWWGIGGRKRAKIAKRDAHGRFKPSD